jgi:diguanylate cyclase (GGDEF)-like protein/PAS domain S-box-containing protein
MPEILQVFDYLDVQSRPRILAERIKGDDARIAAEILSGKNSTDPFAQAVRATRMPMVITDPRQPDNPVVFVNDAFCRLTGYDRAEILGRNCRFMQAPDTDPEAVRRIRTAIENQTSIEIDIRNCRKDGEPFWNRLLLAPVWDESGTLAYFFASQVDVTIERERLAGLESDNAALVAELAGRLRAQQESEARLRFAAEAGRLGLWEIDLHTHAMTASPVCKENFGYDGTAAFTYADCMKSVHPEDYPVMEAALRESFTSGRDYEVECRIVRRDGTLSWLQMRGQVTRSINGMPLRLAGISFDVTLRKATEMRRRALVELGDLTRDLDDPAVLVDATAEVLGRTLNACRAGYGTVDLAAETLTVEGAWAASGHAKVMGVRQLRDFGTYIDDLKRGETVVIPDVRQDPRTAHCLPVHQARGTGAILDIPITEEAGVVAIIYVREHRPREWSAEEIGFAREVAERMRMAMRTLLLRRRSEAEMRHLARHDALTGLPNRLLLSERLTDAINRADLAEPGVTVLYLDLDRFKPVNDLFGHAIGDRLLVEVAARLQTCVRESDTVARLGGDEFAIVMPKLAPALAIPVAERIIGAVSKPFDLESHQVEIGVSVGVSRYPQDAVTGEELLRCADIAMYRSKDEGNTFRLFEDKMDAELHDRRALERDLRHALARSELELHYQPIADCSSGKLAGFEALLRWNHPTRGTVSPGAFIPIAEETGLIVPIGRWVLQTACREAARWPEPLHIAVNLSPVQFGQRNLPEEIRAMVAGANLCPARLALEVTEGVLIDNPDRAMTILSALKAQGIQISLDDFGTGYSSLSYLRRFPFDTIKVDREFTFALGAEKQASAILEAVGVLARGLDLAVVAEGVETEEQLRSLRSQGCTYVQGFLIGRPIPRGQVSKVVAAFAASS